MSLGEPRRSLAAGALGRRLLAAGVVLLAVAAIVGYYAWQQRAPSRPAARGMSAAEVVSTRASSAGRVEVTAAYDVGGRHTVTGEVDAAAFAEGGKVVWVCYAPGSPGDTSKAHLRLPTDELCSQG